MRKRGRNRWDDKFTRQTRWLVLTCCRILSETLGSKVPVRGEPDALLGSLFAVMMHNTHRQDPSATQTTIQQYWTYTPTHVCTHTAVVKPWKTQCAIWFWESTVCEMNPNSSGHCLVVVETKCCLGFLPHTTDNQRPQPKDWVHMEHYVIVLYTSGGEKWLLNHFLVVLTQGTNIPVTWRQNQPLEHILISRSYRSFFPTPLALFYRLEAVHLGGLMWISVQEDTRIRRALYVWYVSTTSKLSNVHPSLGTGLYKLMYKFVTQTPPS